MKEKIKEKYILDSYNSFIEWLIVNKGVWYRCLIDISTGKYYIETEK